VWLRVMYFSYGPACILLGVLSWKRANFSRTTSNAVLLLLARIITFILAFGFLCCSIPSTVEWMADSTSEMQSETKNICGVLALIFFGATIWLTLGSKDKSAKRKAYQQSGRYVIDPRDFRTDGSYVGWLVVFWLIWAPATAIATYYAYTQLDPFFIIWSIFGWLPTIGIPVSLFTKKTKQILEVTGKSLVVNGIQGYPSFRAEIDKQNLKALTLEHYEDSDSESVYTLNLFQKSEFQPDRIMLASFVHPKDKAVLFDEIREFLQKNGFVFEVKNEMAC